MAVAAPPADPGLTAVHSATDVPQAPAVNPAIAYHNLSVVAGESFTVHAPEVPVAVDFDFHTRCPGSAEVQTNTQRSVGKSSVSMLLDAGTTTYVVRCLDARAGGARVVARGTAQVLHDPGTAAFPPKPPSSTIDADGRSYTVFYQNQLPEVRVRWPNAPSAAIYGLTRDSHELALPAPEHVFRSGSLREGAHQLTFHSGERRSRTTTVVIRFDNAAPKASLLEPRDRAFTVGQSVSVRGVALPTWKVSVAFGTINKDESGRFSGEVVTNLEHPDVAVCLRHPRLGTHYYLRRAINSR
jgi:hypothetical protein